jgi:hypothetical protein
MLYVDFKPTNPPNVEPRKILQPTVYNGFIFKPAPQAKIMAKPVEDYRPGTPKRPV